MIPGLPSPWLLLGFLVALIGAYWSGNWQGHKAERSEWLAAQVEQEKATQKLKDENAVAVRAAEARYAAFKDSVGRTNAESLTRINGLRIANGRLVAAAGGLYDRNGRPSGEVGVPGNSPATGSPATAATGCRLSAETSERLLDLARDADAAAVYAQTGHAYAVGLPR